MDKIIDFETVTPLFEQERSGVKCWTFREHDGRDSRFRALAQWRRGYRWRIRITNPSTGEQFVRTIVNRSYLWRHWDTGLVPMYDWMIIEWEWGS